MTVIDQTIIRHALDGDGGELPRIAAEAVTSLAAYHDGRGRQVNSRWMTETYLAVVALLERRSNVPTWFTPEAKRPADHDPRDSSCL